MNLIIVTHQPNVAFIVFELRSTLESFAMPTSDQHTQSHGIAKRLQPFGETIFSEISRLASEHDAINLGQGFPNFDGPDFVCEAAKAAIDDGNNQYARSAGVAELCQAIADRFERDAGLAVDPMSQVTVTSGCTEALAAAFIGLCNPGDEVILFEPFYDCYRANVAMAGSVARFVSLPSPNFSFDADQLAAAFNEKTKAILINSPHNPTGKMFSQGELQCIANLCKLHDVIAISDEVYEHITFGKRHISIATLDGMFERTVTLNSLGKTFSLTGWKVGWAIAPEHLTAGIRAAHQFLNFATATPLQHGAVAALRAGDDYFQQLQADYRQRRDRLLAGLFDAGFRASPPDGTYFILADHSVFGFENDVEFCQHLIQKIGVAAIPPSFFYHNKELGKSLIRFAFCKDDATLDAAIERLRQLKL